MCMCVHVWVHMGACVRCKEVVEWMGVHKCVQVGVGGGMSWCAGLRGKPNYSLRFKAKRHAQAHMHSLCFNVV